MNAAAAKHFTLQEPARFLRLLAQSSGRLDLRDVWWIPWFGFCVLNQCKCCAVHMV
jgi:hypothetical protein